MELGISSQSLQVGKIVGFLVSFAMFSTMLFLIFLYEKSFTGIPGPLVAVMITAGITLAGYVVQRVLG